ncbi:peptide MFS transporter [Flavobacterium lindanitolerans]|uniref:POT family proton-dependent oligopeptide transporter n=1 Tax=Flavobacterium lindanitolerans TaxID=428988 RepID=A0A497VCT2_9FLAO|nr:peptide MFS transporter [Flavobacterium lindanitolerans]PKW28516.1 POT family proton-dependent oligopeptide transporter [Flavobacterium lindanitolerans]RLJ35979.1 POT family proton-dependent oligopeptide transporter [Flavobacterium lindanitolerans]
MSEITSTNNDFFKSKVLGHPSGLFVLFFTEMWERFSFYGMRVLLINFLTMAAIGTNPGWEWTSENAGALFGTYAGLLYLTPIVGGIIADKFTGYRWAVVIGALIMTSGHASMALETEFSMYFGLGLLVIGTGFFKPNIVSIISEMYKDLPEKKDGAYTIFYMGVNAGAFFGMMLCGYLGEKIGWSWGFGLAGIFMLLGSLQFWLAKPLFGSIGDVPKRDKVVEAISPDGQIDITEPKAEVKPEDKRNPFTMLDKVLIVITSIIGLLYLIDDPASKIGNIHLLPQEFLVSKEVLPGALVITIIGLVLFLFLVISRISRYTKVVRDRMIAVIVFAFFTVFFWLSFEQGATSLILFARDFTDRTLMGNQAIVFNIINTLLTIIPLALISWVLFLLFRQTAKKIATSNIILALSFLGVWGIVVWMLNNDYNSKAYELKYQAIKTAQIDKKTKKQAVDENGDLVFDFNAVTETTVLKPTDVVVDQTVTISSQEVLKVNDKVALHSEIGNFVYLTKGLETKIRDDYKKATKDSQIIKAEVVQLKENQVEVTASWFSILNSFFIIAFASMFSKWWDSKYNPSAAVKYGLGLIIMGLGFAILAYGARVIPSGAEAGAVRVSMIWLILAYLFHTWGELCLSPVGLSYVSKLVPARMIAFMFGMWYLAIAIGNKLAGSLGGMIEGITKEYDMSTFFLIFTIVPIVAGLIVVALNPMLKKLMHGVR